MDKDPSTGPKGRVANPFCRGHLGAVNVPWAADGRLKARARWFSPAGDWVAGAHVGI